MNEEEAVYILKEARINQKCKLVCPDNTEDCLDCENEAIQVILKLYEKQTNIIKNAINYIQHNNKELKNCSEQEMLDWLYGLDKCCEIKEKN